MTQDYPQTFLKHHFTSDKQRKDVEVLQGRNTDTKIEGGTAWACAGALTLANYPSCTFPYQNRMEACG